MLHVDPVHCLTVLVTPRSTGSGVLALLTRALGELEERLRQGTVRLSDTLEWTRSQRCVLRGRFSWNLLSSSGAECYERTGDARECWGFPRNWTHAIPTGHSIARNRGRTTWDSRRPRGHQSRPRRSVYRNIGSTSTQFPYAECTSNGVTHCWETRSRSPAQFSHFFDETDRNTEVVFRLPPGLEPPAPRDVNCSESARSATKIDSQTRPDRRCSQERKWRRFDRSRVHDRLLCRTERRRIRWNNLRHLRERSQAGKSRITRKIEENQRRVSCFRSRFPRGCCEEGETRREPGKTTCNSLPNLHRMRESRERPESRSGLELAHPRHLRPKGQGAARVDSGRECSRHRVSPRKRYFGIREETGKVHETFRQSQPRRGNIYGLWSSGRNHERQSQRQRQRRGRPRLNRLDPYKTSEPKSGVSRPSLSGNKTSNVLFRHEWGGWGAIFNAIVLFQGKSQFATFLCKSIVNAFSQWQSRQRRVPTVDGRSRARHRRALIRDLVRIYIESSLQWLRTGCLRPSEAPVGRSVRQLASRAALEACRTSPLAFAGDRRGRMREILAGIIHRIPSPLNTSTLEFSAGPSTWSYDGSCKPIGAMKVTSV